MAEQVESKTQSNQTGEEVAFIANLSDLKGCDPIQINLDQNTLIKNLSSEIKKLLKLDENVTNNTKTDLHFQNTLNLKDKLPKTFELKVCGKENIIDFANNKFTISSDTRFIEYWNDFLDEAIIYDEEKKTDQVEGEIQYEGKLKVTLKDNGTKLNIGDAEIEFMRTLRIPDDNKTYPLPPSLGEFDIVKVQDYIQSDGLPNTWRKRKGVIIPMWQKEAMWMSFTSTKQCLYIFLCFCIEYIYEYNFLCLLTNRCC